MKCAFCGAEDTELVDYHVAGALCRDARACVERVRAGERDDQEGGDERRDDPVS